MKMKTLKIWAFAWGGLGVLPLMGGEWRDLFDGKSLQGWTFDVLDDSDPAEIFSVREGVIDINGAGRSNGVMRTTESFADFEIRFEWRWPGEPGNSGCLIYCSEPRFMNVWPKSVEVQVQHTNAGDLISTGEDVQVPAPQRLVVIPAKEKWKVRLRPNSTDDSEHPPGDWNKMHIVARDGRVTVTVNDVVVNRGYDLTARSGQICFQAEKAHVQYRSVQVKVD